MTSSYYFNTLKAVVFSFEDIPIFLQRPVDLNDNVIFPANVQLTPVLNKEIKVREQYSGNTSNDLLENFVHCLKENDVKLSVRLWKEIIRLCDLFRRNALYEAHARIGLQVFFVLSKLDPVELFKQYNRSDPKVINSDLAFEDLFRSICIHLKEWDSTKVRLASEEMSKKVKTFLKRPAIVNSILFYANEMSATINPDTLLDSAQIKRIIDTMNIYSVPRMHTLNGITVLDGIVVSQFRLVSKDDSETLHDACLYTVCAHECAHFAVRFLANNFCFSSPLQRDSAGNKITNRLDSVEEGKNFETGRSIELLLFDNIQPNWHQSGEKAAAVFIDRVELDYTFPVIRKDEHKELGLAERHSVSVSSSCDLNMDSLFCL